MIKRQTSLIVVTAAVNAAILSTFSGMPANACAFSFYQSTNPNEFQFSVPAQPLSSALEAFAQQAGIQILYDSPVSAASWTNGIQGRMSVDEALESLLLDSGLVSSRADFNAIVLFSPPPAVLGREKNEVAAAPALSGMTLTLDTLHVDAPSVPSPMRRASHEFYGRAVQSEVISALKRDAATRRRRYTLRLTFHIGAAGDVTRTALLTSTGDVALDASIRDVIAELVFSPPPADLRQPVRMIAAVD